MAKDIKDYQEQFNTMIDSVDLSEIPKKFDINIYNSYHSRKYIDLAITPHLDFTIDRQSEKGLKNIDNSIIFYGTVNYSLTLHWLCFSIYFTYTKVTGLWEE